MEEEGAEEGGRGSLHPCSGTATAPCDASAVRRPEPFGQSTRWSPQWWGGGAERNNVWRFAALPIVYAIWWVGGFQK